MRIGTLIASVVCAVGAGCAQSNEGSVDHRWIETPQEVAMIDTAGANLRVMTPTPPVPTSGMHKFTTAPSKSISVGQSLTITLETAFVRGTQEEITDPRSEYVILANVRELGKGGIQYTESAEEQARVVYYTNDLRQHVGGEPGQFLSLTSLPLYGPLIYEGKPVIVEMHAVELDDAEAESMRSLLSSLADLGGKLYAPASPALGILEAVGSGFLSGAQNDKELRNHPVFYPFRGDDGATHSFLQEGDLVIIKRGTERFGILGFKGSDTGPVPWDRLNLCTNDKRLYLDGELYRGHTYFVLNVTTRQPALENEIANTLYQQFGTFLDALESEHEPSEVYQSSVRNLLENVERRTTMARASAAVATLRDEQTHRIEKSIAWQRLFDILRTEARAQAGGSNTARRLSDAEMSALLIELSRIVPEANRDLVSFELFADSRDARDVLNNLGITW